MTSLIDLCLVEQFKKENTTIEKEISALHSGNLGDIIYALPTCQVLGVNHLILNILEDPNFNGRELREVMAKALVPLLLAQTHIKMVSIIRSGAAWEFSNLKKFGIDYNLDSFRLNISVANLHLVYQHALPFNMWVDASKLWLQTPHNYQSPVIPSPLTNI